MSRPRKPDLQFSGEVVPADLTRDEIREMSNDLAREIARETQQAIAQGQGGSALYLRIYHERSFTRTGDTKSVDSKWGVGGRGDIDI